MVVRCCDTAVVRCLVVLSLWRDCAGALFKHSKSIRLSKYSTLSTLKRLGGPKLTQVCKARAAKIEGQLACKAKPIGKV